MTNTQIKPVQAKPFLEDEELFAIAEAVILYTAKNLGHLDHDIHNLVNAFEKRLKSLPTDVTFSAPEVCNDSIFTETH